MFAGATGLTSTMNNSYSITGLTVHQRQAGSFNIGASGGSALTVTSSGMTNNSANVETLNVPVLLTNAAQTLERRGGQPDLGQTVDNGGNLLTVATAGSTMSRSAVRFLATAV